MKRICLLLLMLIPAVLLADENKQEWQASTLSDDTIKNIQASKIKYLQCITAEAQHKDYLAMDTRLATDKIIQHCEKQLTEIREVFIDENVPEEIADRYLKSTRTQTARKVLEQMMYAAAERQAVK